MNKDNILALAICITAVVMFCLWKFSQMFGLDITTSSKVLSCMFFVSLFWLTVWVAFKISIVDALPVAFASYAACWWVALDYWADHSHQTLTQDNSGTIWFASTIFKFGLLFIAGIAGHVIKKLFK